MPLSPFSTGESRLIHLTLEELNAQRAKAGATATSTVYNSRTAEANAARQNATSPSTATAITDPAAASLQRLRQTQEYLSQNPSVDPTGSINAAARQGQTLAEGYKAPVNQGNLDYYAQQAQFLDNANATYKNAAAGQGSQVNYKIDTTEGSPTFGQVIQSGDVGVSSTSKINQSAIDTLRKAGLSEEEILSNLQSPARNAAISQTASNTGLGGTARQSATILSPQQAQSILATSRDPVQRKAAQAYLDQQVSNVKGYVTQTSVDPKTGSTYQYSSEDAGATANAQNQFKATQAQQRANDLKTQENKQKMESFVAGVDTKQFEQTSSQIQNLMNQISTLSPELQNAVLPSLIQLQNSSNEYQNIVAQILSSQPSDQEIEQGYGTMENYILSTDQKMKDIADKNKELSLQVAQYNKDALEIEKKIIEQDAYVAEQKQAQMNIENEKKIRRNLARLGIESDTNGLSYLHTEIQKGVDAMNNLKTSNNLISLKAQLAIGDGYKLDVQKALNDYEANYLNISTQTADKLNTIRNSIATAKSDRDKGIIEALKWGADKKAENDRAAAKMISDANMKMIDETNRLRDDQRMQEQFALTLQDRKDARDEAAATRSDSAFARAETNSANTALREVDRLTKRINADPVLKPYQEVKMKFATVDADFTRTMSMLEKFNNGEVDRPTMNFVDQGLINSVNKLWDESSVVRESEYARTPQGLSIKRRMEAWVSNKLNGGILNESERNDLKETINTMYNVWKDAADVSLEKFYNQLNLTNSKLLPQDRLMPEDFGLSNITSIGKGPQQEFNNDSIEQMLQRGESGGETVSTTIGTRKVAGSYSLISALKQADEAFYADHGEHIFVNSSFRSTEQQQAAYDRYRRGEIALAAKPGTSFHEKGNAIDVTNWKEAEPYLIRFGLNPLPKEYRSKDPAHFQLS